MEVLKSVLSVFKKTKKQKREANISNVGLLLSFIQIEGFAPLWSTEVMIVHLLL